MVVKVGVVCTVRVPRAGEKTATSNSSGVYTFSNLKAGTCRVRRGDLPKGYKLSIPSSGFYDLTLKSGQTLAGKDLGAVLV